MSRLAGGAVTAGTAALAAYLIKVRPWHMKWGATEAEVQRPMPGDEIVAHPTYVTNRAISIEARPADIWAWLVQMGEGQGGFPSYDWVENLMGMQVMSADEILPEFQELKAGDVVRAGPEGIPVISVDSSRSLVLGFTEEQAWGKSTWSVGLYPADDDYARLVSRVRARLSWNPKVRLFLPFLEPGMFAMERKWLMGVKRRSETATRARQEQPVAAPGKKQQAA